MKTPNYTFNLSNRKCLILMRLDGIGDYILFRNFIPFFKTSEKYSDYKLILIGNKLLKEVVEQLDKDNFAQFIWVDVLKYYSSTLYRCSIYLNMLLKRPSAVINCMYSRHPAFDKIVRYSTAKEKIGFYGDLSRASENEREKSSSYYNKLYRRNESYLFEFCRNKNFIESILNCKIDLPKPVIDTLSMSCTPELSKYITGSNYVLIFIGGSHVSKKYSIYQYVKLIGYLLEEKDLLILLAGDKSEISEGEGIVNHTDSINGRVVNLCGKTNIKDLILLIKNALLLISNESSAPHIAVAVNTNVVTISNGQHFGRFSPYPKHITTKYSAVYPDGLNDNTGNNLESLAERFSSGYALDINEIQPETIYSQVQCLLKN